METTMETEARKEPTLHGAKAADWDPNPSCSEKSTFRKVTVTVSPDWYERLVSESARRKIERAPNRLLAAMLREAVLDYLNRLDAGAGLTFGFRGPQ